ncbi:GlxA family transcriptional regulator [Microbacterium amylolyticum]|uniref:Transcriptional regulator GlxA family with amidase domain n=1 Tax=Microbacterium amylolyticum TaxID=936337 RepID=A0ABS4ZHK4_9MICO|nr:helix-turn-helix domain-containing protein [Microbacterium amylolyticum]MBP2436766.1 transcriptional regulator GlxA family with amidase domain [Microbacterium amylolyticum]
MIRTVACVLQEGFTAFEFGVVCEAFALDRSEQGVPSFDFRVVTPEPGMVEAKIGFRIEVENDLSFAEEADLIVIVSTPPLARFGADPRVLDLVREAVARGAWVLSVCSGAFTLAAAGVLDGKRATTHWMYADEMARRFPAIDVDPDVLYVQHDRIITSAGTAAGIDACLHLLRQEIGAELTNVVARRMVVAPHRDGGQAQFIDSPLPEHHALSLAPVADWALDRLRDDLSVDDLAARAHMSSRTFARRFKADYGVTPAAWLGRQRVMHAQRLLERTDWGLDLIAADSGFGSAAVLRQNFARVLGLTPTAYRERFCGTAMTRGDMAPAA